MLGFTRRILKSRFGILFMFFYPLSFLCFIPSLVPIPAFSQRNTNYLTCDEQQYAKWVDIYNATLPQKNADIRIQKFTDIITQVHDCKNFMQTSFVKDSNKFDQQVFQSNIHTHRGKAFEEKKRNNEACRDYKTAMDLNMGNLIARKNYRSLCIPSAAEGKQNRPDEKKLSGYNTPDRTDTSIETEESQETTDVIDPLQLSQDFPKNKSKIKLTNFPPSDAKTNSPAKTFVQVEQPKDWVKQQEYTKYSAEPESGFWVDLVFYILGILFISGVAVLIYFGIKGLERKKEIAPQLEPLEIARTFSETGEHEKAIKSLRDSLIISAILDKKTADVLDIFEKADRLMEFVTVRSKDKPPEFYSAYGRELIQRRHYAEVLELYKHNKAMQLNIEDMDNIFQANLRLGDFERARDTVKIMLDQKDRIPFEHSLELYYNFAQLCEEKNENVLAFKIYNLFVNEKITYKDVADRYKRLEQIVRKPVVTKLLDGKYEMLLQIGIGGMGEVYEGWDHKLERKIAIKKMRPELKKYPEERTVFLREARTVAKLQHPYIVGIHAVVEEPEDIYIVFDYVKGKTLSEILKERKYLFLDECRTFFSHICPAVHYAHEKGIIHKDIKLSNIMIDVNGFAKIMDFGLASEIIKIELKEGRPLEPGKSIGQKESYAGGTLPYMAPEQHRGIVCPQSDIYAMGVCLYEMLTGKWPFDATEPSQLLKQKEEKRLQYPSALKPGLPVNIDRLIFRVLEPEPQNRPQDAMEFLSLLKK